MCVKFCLKTMLKENCLSRHSLESSYKLDKNGRNTWCTKLKAIMLKYGFQYVWDNGLKEMRDIELFLCEFKQRLKDCYIQEWSSNVENNKRLKMFKHVKIMYEKSKYLEVLKHKKHISAIAKFKCSDHRFAIEKGRHLNTYVNADERWCIYCKQMKGTKVIENESHVLVYCPAYNDIRTKYLGIYMTRLNPTNSDILNILLNSKDEHVIRNTAYCLYDIIKFHNYYMKNVL